MKTKDTPPLDEASRAMKMELQNLFLGLSQFLQWHARRIDPKLQGHLFLTPLDQTMPPLLKSKPHSTREQPHMFRLLEFFMHVEDMKDLPHKLFRKVSPELRRGLLEDKERKLVLLEDNQFVLDTLATLPKFFLRDPTGRLYTRPRDIYVPRANDCLVDHMRWYEGLAKALYENCLKSGFSNNQIGSSLVVCF